MENTEVKVNVDTPTEISKSEAILNILKGMRSGQAKSLLEGIILDVENYSTV